MNNHLESGTKPENSACQQWGLKHAITPCFGARLVAILHTRREGGLMTRCSYRGVSNIFLNRSR